MKPQESVLLFFLGLLIWILGTVYYAYCGAEALETTKTQYWVNFAISPVVSAAICLGILRWRHIAPANWAAAMLLLAVPGRIGEAVVLVQWKTFMPKLRADSGGKYGAFLFAAYAVVLGLAELVTLRATR